MSENRLIREASPYLQQHAHNPVDWYPWGEEAFEKARRENRPIFLSIGYSACHWCHVMEREVFENETLAAYLNEHFVSIKVDKEERPDIDAHFQRVHQLLTRRAGGWPASIFLTPEKEPFFAATYIPPSRKNGIIGFDELTATIVEKLREEPHIILDEAKIIKEALGKQGLNTQATKIGSDIIDHAVTHMKELYDATSGGFSQAPKFPHTGMINLLLDAYEIRRDPEVLEMAVFTLKEMARGGLYDLVDGGFCRYSVDEWWLVPHFEKMTYDNALLIPLYLRAYRLSSDARLLEVALETAAFMEAKMSGGRLFYTASDADSDGEEGKYFVYSHAEARAALLEAQSDEAVVDKALKALSIRKVPNFENHSIVRMVGDAKAADYRWALEKLAGLRKSRNYPFIDRKIIASQNAMMVRALFTLSREDASYLEKAKASLESLMAHLCPDGELFHTFMSGHEPKVAGFLEDYAYVCDALLEGYERTLERSYLDLAVRLADEAVKFFYRRGRWLFSIGEFVTYDEPTDGSFPAAGGVMTDVLVRLGYLVDESYLALAFRSVEYHSITIRKYGAYCSGFVRAAARLNGDAVILKGKKEVLERIDTRAIPHPYVHKKIEGEAGIMVCSQRACYARIEHPEELETITFSF